MKLGIKNRPLRIKHSFEYTCDNNQVKFSLSKNSILIPIFDKERNRQVGYILDGPIGIIADLLVHTKEGAVGEIIEETYSTVLLFPLQIPFLKMVHIKEIQPLEEFRKYEDVIKKYESQIRRKDYISSEYKEGMMIQTYNPNSLWFIGKDSTFLIETEEIIGRKGEIRLIWLEKDSFTIVNKRGKVKTTIDAFSVKKMRKTIHRILDVPLNAIFASFKELFTSI